MTAELGEFTIVRPLRALLGRGPRRVRAYAAIYSSGDLAISAHLYFPPEDYDGSPRSAHPLDLPAPAGGAIVVGHGGVWGIPTHYDFVLRRLAASGWSIVAPTYRGEGGSDGQIEFAVGEVDDTLACWRALTDLPDIDPKKTWLLGSSHGAMVSLLVLAREDSPREIPGAVAVSGVYDLQSWLEWIRLTGHPLSEDSFIQYLGTLDAQDLDRRSALKVAGRIAAPVFLIHGESDTMVPVEETKSIGQALEEAGKTNWRMRIEPGADHEYIWAPDRPNAVATWREILRFMEEN